MQELEAIITRKGLVTLPLEIRRALGLVPHDRVRFVIEGNTVRMTKVPSAILKWYQSVQPLNGPKNVRDLCEEFESGVAEEAVARIKGITRTEPE